jgi:hypothetical protein
MPSFCLFVCTVGWAPEPYDGFYSFSVFKSLLIIGECPLNMNILDANIWDLQISHKNKTDTLYKMTLRIFTEY